MLRILVIARYAWALPATLAGLLLSLIAFALGAKGRLVEGAVEIAGGRIDACVSMLPRHCRFGAITFGHIIIGVDHQTLAHHRLHEHIHVRQYERWGVLFFPLYLGSSLLQIARGRDPYLSNAFEREAFANSVSREPRPNPAVNRTPIGDAPSTDVSSAPVASSRQAARMRARLGVFVLLFMPLLVCGQETRTEAMFTQWKGSNRLAVDLFAGHLEAQSLSEVIELHQLLRSASSWQQCNAEPFAVPPREQWAEVVSALRLVKELVTRGILGRFEVHSAYRNAELNECAGGAAGSAHLHTFAVDLVPLEGIDPAPLLCRFWSEHGRSWNMGLSRYPSGRIHIDTSGYRTWGADHTGKYAYCTSAA